MRIEELTRMQLVEFHVRMGAELGVKYIGDPGIIQKLWRRFLNLITRRFVKYIPPDARERMMELRPMCFKNINYLTYVPGAADVPAMRQIRVAIHEPTHSLDIRKYPGTVANWYGEYFTKAKKRAMSECSAHAAENEFTYWYSGKMLELNLDSYYLTEQAYETARKDYAGQCKNLKELGRGTAFHRSAAVAISILKDMGVEQVNN